MKIKISFRLGLLHSSNHIKESEVGTSNTLLRSFIIREELICAYRMQICSLKLASNRKFGVVPQEINLTRRKDMIYLNTL
jgi:hypothetical protein